MGILHIINVNERNSLNLFKQLDEKFDLSEHTFLIANYERIVKSKFKDFYKLRKFIYIEENNFVKKIGNLYLEMKKADKIIFHSLIFNTNKYLLMLNFVPSILKKSVWIEWGADLYNWQRPNTTLKNKILNKINYNVRKRIPVVGLTFEADKDAVIEQFGEKTFFNTPLPFGIDRIKLLQSICSKNRNVSDTLNIQVAHNALPFNNHLCILEKLEKFKYNNIRIIMPLSYGTYGIAGQYKGGLYKRNIEICARGMFPKKIVTLEKPISLSHYLEYLWNIDIAIFDCDRPIAIANIYYLYFLGKKIYLPKDSPHYKYFIANNMKVYETESISSISFEEFQKNDLKPAFDPINPDNPMLDILAQRFVPYRDVMQWGNLFDFLTKKTKDKNGIKK